VDKKLITGIDDATKCPCIGSIFVAGVTADQETIEQWQKLGVKDSKLITHKKIQKLAKIIKETATLYSVDHLPPSMIDNKNFNLNEWEMLVVLRILKKLKYTENQDVYIDNWETTSKGFKNRFKSLLKYSKRSILVENKLKFNRSKLNKINIIAEHRADENYTIVGAASILAKDASIKQYKKYKKMYGDFGSGSPADPKTRLFVWTHRQNTPEIIRKSWNTFKTLVNLEKFEDDPLFNLKNRLLYRRKKKVLDVTGKVL